MTGNTGAISAARPAAVATVLCGVQLVDVLGVTVLATALPRMVADLGASQSQVTVVVTAYAMFFGGLLLLAARLGDVVGHRRIVLVGLGVFAAASLVAALTSSPWVLAGARAGQGAAAAASVPAALRLLTTLVPEGRVRQRAVAAWSSAGAVAGATGFVVGGVLTELASWRVVFWINLPLAALLAAALVATVPRDVPARPTTPIAWGSGALLTAGVMALVVGATAIEAERYVLGVLLLLAGVAALVGFIALERVSDHPLVPLEAWRATRLRWGSLGSFANTATTSSSFTVATFYLQGPLGLDPLQAAGLLVSFSVLVVLGSALAPAVLRAAGHTRALAAGLGVVATGDVVLVAWPSALGVAVAAGTAGLGLGIASVAATDLGTTVADGLKSAASGLLNTSAQLGTALGTAAILLIATTLGDRTAWTLAAAVAAASAIAALARGSAATAQDHRPR